MKLIEEWKTCYKFLSVKANALAAAVGVTYAQYYDEMKEIFPPKYMITVLVAAFIASTILRVISQTKKKDEKQ